MDETGAFVEREAGPYLEGGRVVLTCKTIGGNFTFLITPNYFKRIIRGNFIFPVPEIIYKKKAIRCDFTFYHYPKLF